MRFLWTILIVLLSLNIAAAQEKPPRITPANFDQLTQVAQSDITPTLYKLIWLDTITLVAPGTTETLFYNVETGEARSVPIQSSDSIAFSTDTSSAVSLAYPNKLILWDGKTGTKLVTVDLTALNITKIGQIVFVSNTSDFLTTDERGEIHYWQWVEIIAGKIAPQLLRTPTPGAENEHIAVTPIPESDAISIAIWDKGGMMHVWETQKIADIAHDEKAVWESATGIDRNGVLQFSADGQRLSASYNGSRVEWDAHTGAVLSRMDYQSERSYSLSWSPNGNIILNHFITYGLYQSEDKLINVDKPDQSVSLPNIYGPWAFSPDGHYLAYVDWDGRIRLRHLQASGEKFLPSTYSWDYSSVEFNVAGDLMLVRYRTRADKYGAVLWNLTTLTQRAVLREPIIFTPGGGSLAVGNEGGSVSILDGFTLLESRRFSTGYISPITVLAFSPSGQQLAAGDSDGHVTLWDIETGLAKTMTTENDHYKEVRALWFSSDNTVLVSGNAGSNVVEVWDIATVQRRFRTGGMIGVTLVSFSPDNRFLLVGGIKMVGAGDCGIARIYDVQSGQELGAVGGIWLAGELPDVKPDRIGSLYKPHNPHWTFIDQAHWFTDGDALLTTSRDAVRVWDLPTIFQYGIGVRISQAEGTDEQIYGFSPPGASQMTDSGRVGGVGEVVFSPTEPLLVFWDKQNEIQFWDMSDPHHIQVDKQPDGNRYYSFVFSPDGEFLLGLNSEKAFRIWDTKTHLPQSVHVPALSLLKDQPQDSWIRSFQFSPDGTRLIVLCGDAVRILQVQ